MGLIERRDEGFGEEVWKENSLWYRVVGQRERLRREKGCVATAFYHAEAFLFVLNPTSFVNYLGYRATKAWQGRNVMST